MSAGGEGGPLPILPSMGLLRLSDEAVAAGGAVTQWSFVRTQGTRGR